MLSLVGLVVSSDLIASMKSAYSLECSSGESDGSVGGSGTLTEKKDLIKSMNMLSEVKIEVSTFDINNKLFAKAPTSMSKFEMLKTLLVNLCPFCAIVK